MSTSMSNPLFRKIWFQTHWLLGISAGLVLALMGVTGALLSFENELLRALNPGVMTVPAREHAMLTPPQLLARLAETEPQRAVGTISVSAIPGRAARVGFLPADVAGGKGDARPRMDVYLVDPYSGALLGSEDDARGHEALHFTEDLHRRLAGGDTGKAITGASTLTLLVLAASGLYLRWPRRWRDPRAWLAVRWRLRASPFLKSLHEVFGTWLLLPYLLIALTGLWWSYDGYREALQQLAGSTAPTRQTLRTVIQPAAPLADLERAWATFLRETASTGYYSASFNVPAAGQPLVLNYLDANPPHERANNRLILTLDDGSVKTHERYADKSTGGQLTSSVFALHKGSYFGLPGTIVIMLCSLCMPLFAVTGWMLYIKRRRLRRRAEEARLVPDSA